MPIRLTNRQEEVLEHLLQGHNAAEIADRLGLSVETVRVHTKRIFKKLDVHGKTELLAKRIRGEL
jgi:DNA-binding CsgD family transcriptional regulator